MSDAKHVEEHGPEVVMRNGDPHLHLVTLVEGYSSGEVIVRPTDNKKLLIMCRSSQEVIKTYDLPECLDPFVVEAQMSDDSVLTVTAPLTSVF